MHKLTVSRVPNINPAQHTILIQWRVGCSGRLFLTEEVNSEYVRQMKEMEQWGGIPADVRPVIRHEISSESNSESYFFLHGRCVLATSYSTSYVLGVIDPWRVDTLRHVRRYIATRMVTNYRGSTPASMVLTSPKSLVNYI